MQNKKLIQGPLSRKRELLIVLLFVSLTIAGCITSTPLRTITLSVGAQDRIRNNLALAAWNGRSITEALEIWGEPTYVKGTYVYMWVETSTNVHGIFQCKTEMNVLNDKITNTSWQVVDVDNDVDREKILGLSFYLINKAPPGFNIYEAFNLEEANNTFENSHGISVEFSESR